MAFIYLDVISFGVNFMLFVVMLAFGHFFVSFKFSGNVYSMSQGITAVLHRLCHGGDTDRATCGVYVGIDDQMYKPLLKTGKRICYF